MDIADNTYLKWQMNLYDIFEKKLIFKHHPKDKFKNIYKRYHYHSNVSNDNIHDILNSNQNICFIFDTIGTAFAETAASNFPIIFFDLHQRKIPSFVLEKIKKRCIYLDLTKISEISLSYIVNLLINKNFDYDALDVFSLENIKSSTDQIDAIKSYFRKKI